MAGCELNFMSRNENIITDRTKISLNIGAAWLAAVALVAAAWTLAVNAYEIKTDIRTIKRESVTQYQMQQFNDALREQNDTLPLKVPPFPKPTSHREMTAAVVAQSYTQTKRAEN
jgi:hypothetical protein